MSARPSLAWCTNLAAPYRLPVWTALAAKVELHVRTLALVEPGRHWEWPRPDGYSLETLPTRSIRIRDGVLYALRGNARRDLPQVSALILPGWENPAAWQLRAWARRNNVATIAFYESTTSSHRSRSGPLATARAKFLGSAGSVLTVGEESRAAVLGMGVPGDRVITGFNPVDVEWFTASAAEHRNRAPASMCSGHRFLYVGQLIERKNVDTLLDAFASISAPGDSLTIAGDGPLRQQLMLKASAITSGSVRFVGHVDHADLPALYASADTLVLPSTTEVWGLVVNEALACGLHAVVSDRCGVVASVTGMPGVYPSAPTESDLAAAMRASRDTWRGPVTDPPILAHTPSAFADRTLEAVECSIARLQ